MAALPKPKVDPFQPTAELHWQEAEDTHQKLICNQFSHFRNTTPTADSLYHATVLFLLDYFTHPSTNVTELELFYKRLFYSELPIPDDDYIGAYATTLEGLWRLRETIQEGKKDKTSELREKLIGVDQYMQAFTQVLRCLAYEGVMVLKPDEAYSPGAEEAMKGMLELGDRRVEDVDLWGLAAALDVHITLEKLDLSSQSTYKSVRSGENKLRLSLATVTHGKSEFHHSPYYPLYPQGWELHDGAAYTELQERLHLRLSA